MGMHLDCNRVVAELGAAGFKDRRLAVRLQGLAERLVLKPDASFPKALRDSAELEAAYRFFGNVAVNPDAIPRLAPEGPYKRHQRVPVARIRRHGTFSNNAREMQANIPPPAR